MELLLLSSSRTRAGYLTDYLAPIRAFSAGIRNALFVPYAAVSLDWNEYARKVGEALAPVGVTVKGIQSADDLLQAELIIVGGGNTFQLLRECRARGLLEDVRNGVIAGKLKYLGWSAGANLACPTIKTTNDMPIVDPRGLEGLGLVPFQINPHYVNVALPGHHGETRDERLAEFARVNPSLPVIGLPEGDWLRMSGSLVELEGPHPAIWFEGAKPPVQITPGTWRRVTSSNAAYDENPANRTPR